MTAHDSSSIIHRPATPRSRVVVVGGGYAGVLAANRIAARAGAAVDAVLVSDRDELVHRVRLHEMLSGTRTVRYPLGQLLDPRVRHVHARVARIDADASVCELASGERLVYDQLVLTVGSHVHAPVPGAREQAMALAGPDTALAFAARIRDLPEGASVAVVGGGLTAVEVACELAAAHPRLRVAMVAEALQLRWPAPLEARLRRELHALGIELHLGAAVHAVGTGAVELARGAPVPAAATVWAAGFRSAPLAADSGLPVDPLGRVLVDESLRVPSHPEVIVAGDAAAAPLACVGSGAVPMRMACATAMPMGAHAADVALDQLAGRAPLRFRYRNTVQCVSLGRRRGMLVFIDEDDRPTGHVLTARPGAWAKEAICRAVIGTLRVDRAMPGAYVWPGRGRRRRVDASAARPVPEVATLPSRLEVEP